MQPRLQNINASSSVGASAHVTPLGAAPSAEDPGSERLEGLGRHRQRVILTLAAANAPVRRKRKRKRKRQTAYWKTVTTDHVRRRRRWIVLLFALAFTAVAGGLYAIREDDDDEYLLPVEAVALSEDPGYVEVLYVTGMDTSGQGRLVQPSSASGEVVGNALHVSLWTHQTAARDQNAVRLERCVRVRVSGALHAARMALDEGRPSQRLPLLPRRTDAVFRDRECVVPGADPGR